MLELISKLEAIKMLRKLKISPTVQRIEIAQTLLSKKQHMSAEQVMGVVNQEKPKVSKATVYNTLGLFAEKGLIRQLVIDPSKVFYDSNVSNHHHFFNVDTGELVDIGDEELNINQLPNLPEGTVAEGVDIIIRVKSR